jgi:hypothetical protein
MSSILSIRDAEQVKILAVKTDLEIQELEEYAAREHNCSDPLERAYWQGVKDGLRKALAILRDDEDIIKIINTSAWTTSYGHRNVNDIEPKGEN